MNFFGSEKKESKEFYTGTVEVGDASVEFHLHSSDTLLIEFNGIAFFDPVHSARDDGVYIINGEDQLHNFMCNWHKDSFALIKDTVVKWDDFSIARVTRTTRTVTVKKMLGEGLDGRKR